MAMNISTRKGFTLIEVMTVVAIIGLLSTFIFASMSEAQRRSRDAKRLADIKQVQNALELYADEHGGAYPLVPTSFVFQLASSLVPNYIRVLPEDPVRTGGNRYRYYTVDATNGSSYTILVNLETDDPATGWCRIKLGIGYVTWDQYPACDL
jgi:prepilin-type N-terminal cleavage/methylation domain-containing protein